MKLHTLRRTGALAAAALTLTVGLTACSDEDSSGSTGTGSSETTSEDASPSEDMTESEDTGMDTGMDAGTDPSAATYGPACGEIPSDDSAASFTGMAAEPVATAASANPLLSTLVSAVGEAGLVDALNGAPELTVFAPVNDAFAAIPKKDMAAVMADKDMLTAILSHHVVPQRVEPDQLSGELETLNGDTITIEGEGEEATIGTEGATVLCGGVQTANATVYLIDTVMMPSA
jgi:uncharacterized surface protein with fasciclin (FAS1) repeats